ncbi:MAG: SDR family NAD(P)-dependent oxidoreductase [Ignavibacteriae bacterium]|nr:SDR family NAD(P)-dependent oxidoreductase [Ignavibacteriota bacterium]
MKRKTAIVTGASKGIGNSISLKLAEENFNVMIFGRSEKNLISVKKEILKNNVECEYFIGDVADQNFVNISIKQILKKYKKVDILINNAGVAIFKKFSETTLEDFQTQVNTNVYGVFNFTKSVVENMINNENGTIINIVSQAGKFGFDFGSTYSATKHAVMGFSKSILLELRKFNIRVITVCPGSTDTDMIKNSPIHKNLKQFLKPKDIAEIVISAIKLPQNALISDLEIRPTNP